MKRTPIIILGQVYLHSEYNEYIVVTKANRGNISYAGPDFKGMNEVELFLERFGPVNPVDLSVEEQSLLLDMTHGSTKLSVGWVTPEDGEDDDEY